MEIASNPTHEHFTRLALEQARLSLEAGNMPIGAVIVHNGIVVASGRNAIDHPSNDTQHAELAAIQSIAPFLAAHKRECALYTTLEPCMMCLGAIVNVGIEALVVGAPDQLVGALNLMRHGEYYEQKLASFQLLSGVLAADSQALLNEYVARTGLRKHLARDSQ